MSASKTDDLHIFQLFMASCIDRSRQHPGMEVVHDFHGAFAQVYVFQIRKRIHCHHRNSLRNKHFGKIVVDQGVVLIWAGSQYHRKRSLLFHPVHDLFPGLFQLLMERTHGPVALLERSARLVRRDPESLLHVFRHLFFPVFRRIPVEQRRVERDIPAFFRIVRVADYKWISFYHRAHGLAGIHRILRRNRGNRRHKDPVHALLRQISQMSVHQLGRETYRIGGNRRQSALVDRPRAWRRQLHLEAQAAQKCCPERRRIPERQHAGNSDLHSSVGSRIFHGIFLE